MGFRLVPNSMTLNDLERRNRRLCAHLTVWCELDQSVVNHAIDEWRRRLSVCVDDEGGHFEYYL